MISTEQKLERALALLREFTGIASVSMETGYDTGSWSCGVCERPIEILHNLHRERGHDTDCAVLRARAFLRQIKGRRA